MKTKAMMMMMVMVMMMTGNVARAQSGAGNPWAEHNRDIGEIMDDVCTSWVGSSQKNMILLWGPPADVKPDGGGGYVYVFPPHDRVWWPRDDRAHLAPNTEIIGGKIVFTSFADEKGIVYQCRYEVFKESGPSVLAVMATLVLGIILFNYIALTLSAGK